MIGRNSLSREQQKNKTTWGAEQFLQKEDQGNQRNSGEEEEEDNEEEDLEKFSEQGAAAESHSFGTEALCPQEERTRRAKATRGTGVAAPGGALPLEAQPPWECILLVEPAGSGACFPVGSVLRFVCKKGACGAHECY